jgi:hypothetical protein
MNKYDVMVQVLDRLRLEAPAEYVTYHPSETDTDGLNAARSKAFIHLYLKVRFGLLTFLEREQFVTEGGNDGGIDAYFIDENSRVIFFLQSKFRQSERNFEAKTIEVEELLKMDIDRILDGDAKDLRGSDYNGKIRTMVRKIQALDSISRFKYRVIILANVKELAKQKLSQLVGNFPAEIFNYARCYKELLFPLVSATYYSFGDLHIALNLSNKNAGSKISYSVTTENANVEITVVFVPTLEIAAAMYKYRNAILKHNPRSYLEHEGQTVNSEIRNSILERKTNEFALFNNGITLLSDGTFLNERIGQKDRAQLTIVNPQIINGGQTAYTLSQIYRETEEEKRANVFGNKEVLVKIITFDPNDNFTEDKKLSLIEAISRATNSQTVVSKGDRRSNEPELKQIQERCFDVLGMWLERKRGEFSDGVRDGYLDPKVVVDRNVFFRAVALATGNIHEARTKRVFVTGDFASCLASSEENFKRIKYALITLRTVHQGKGGHAFREITTVSKAAASLVLLSLRPNPENLTEQQIAACASFVNNEWKAFYRYLADTYQTSEKYWHLDSAGRKLFDFEFYFSKKQADTEIERFFSDRGLNNIFEKE